MWKLWGVTIYLTILSLHDIRNRKIPISFLLGGGVVAAMYIIYAIVIQGNGPEKYLAAAFPGLILLATALLTGKVGYADGLLLMMVGPVIGGRQCAVVFCASLFLTAAASAVLLVSRRANRGTEIPYVPFLTVTVLFCGICT